MLQIKQLEMVVQSLWNDLNLIKCVLETQKLNQTLKLLQSKHDSLMQIQHQLKKSMMDKKMEIENIFNVKNIHCNHLKNVEIRLIRHAQSKFNVIEETKSYNKDQNASNDFSSNDLIDCGLSKKGIDECSQINFKFDLLIVSPMKRCLQTLECSNINYKKMIIMDIFREYKTDICDFIKKEEIMYETEKDILNRINIGKDILKYIINDNQEINSIGVISHFDFIWYFTSHLVQNERFGTGLKNAESVILGADKL